MTDFEDETFHFFLVNVFESTILIKSFKVEIQCLKEFDESNTELFRIYLFLGHSKSTNFP